MKGEKPSFVVATVEPAGEGRKDRWIDVGVAFENAKSGTLSVTLSALPLNGKLILYKPRRWDAGAEAPEVELEREAA